MSNIRVGLYKLHWVTLVWAGMVFVQFVVSNEFEKYVISMPSIVPYRAELYLCTPVKINLSTNYFIVGFEPNITSETTHHVLIYGCEAPGTDRAVWSCGEMARHIETEENYAPCLKSTQIIYAWARDAPTLQLPDGVGFKVGGNSKIKYLVLQVHYADNFDTAIPDNSGIILHYTRKPLDKLAGVMLLGTGGVIKPLATTHMEALCTITENKTIHPFAYRTHTHSLGRVVAGYKIREDENGKDIWTLLGKRDPKTPQMFYPIENTEPIIKGDQLVARCTMVSRRTTITSIGARNQDEMCNLYIMYWTDGGSTLDMKYCFSPGPPYYYWYNLDDHINSIPDREASSLPK